MEPTNSGEEQVCLETYSHPSNSLPKLKESQDNAPQGISPTPPQAKERAQFK
jgi:hypothetical protein